MIKSDRSPFLCPGIDPNPKGTHQFEIFKENYLRHVTLLHKIKTEIKVLKPNLAFFLAYGSKGLGLLEDFCDTFRDSHRIILDAKFNEIDKSLQAYLTFAFKELKVSGVTVNPFLGEGTLRLTFDVAAKSAGPEARVYVLCATSQFGCGPLSSFQTLSQNTIDACVQVRQELFQNDPAYAKLAGVVIGANREDVLFSEGLKKSGVSVLAPGLGPQGAKPDVIQRTRQLSNEMTFPIQRALFEEGNISVDKMLCNYSQVKSWFLDEEGNNP
jgi:orotidine-5'-phosphate decarboxylase